MVSELEIWRAARLLIAQYGDGALAHAEERAAELKDKSDADGWARWTRIAAAILEIQNQRKP